MRVKDKTISNKTSCLEVWSRTSRSYSKLISDQSRDSHYLRNKGLKQTLLKIIGDCSSKRVLDVGCGNGWLLDDLRPHEGYGCDVVSKPGIGNKWNFQVQDVRALSYPDSFFDIVVASLLLIWFDELDLAMQQLYRITKPGGRCVIALVHPYFYRTGRPDNNGDFLLEKNLSKPFDIPDLKIGGSTDPLTYFYRPFPDYLNACIQTGYKISHVADWFLDMQDYKLNKQKGMRSRIARTGKIPMYSFIECSKE